MRRRLSPRVLAGSLGLSLFACGQGGTSAPVPPAPPPPPALGAPAPAQGSSQQPVAPPAQPGVGVAARAPLASAPLLDPTTHVLIAGLLQFSDPNLSGFAQADRRDVELGRVLAQRGVPSAQITTLLDQQATRAAILAALTAAADATPAGGTLVFYYAGHGVRTESGQIAYVAYDTHSQHADRPGVSVDDLYAALAPRVVGKRVVLLGDCCHSGGLAALAGRLSALGATALSLTSAEASNLSTGNWTYSQVLLEGLRGDPALDANLDARVDLSELEAGVRTAMRYREGQRSGAFLGSVNAQALSVAERQGPARSGAEAGQFMRDASGQVVRVNRVEGAEATIRYYDYALSRDARAPLSALRPVAATRYAVGTQLMVEWGGRVWPARVTATDGDFAFITYPGWPSYWDEWILSDRVRGVSAVAGNPPIR